ncbi:hypothetical protein GR157_24765 [Burkholderia sp. 4701]|nr:hypothetical protein [Burkholderia sp. 4701]MXN85038.1 hypothetical protein [Burkholderia sp. 4812]
MSSLPGINSTSPRMPHLEESRSTDNASSGLHRRGSVSRSDGTAALTQQFGNLQTSSRPASLAPRASLPTSASASSAAATGAGAASGLSPAPTSGRANDWATWYRDNASKKLAPRHQEVLRYLEETNALKQYRSPDELLTHLKEVNRERPGTEIYVDDKPQFHAFPGEMDPGNHGFPKNWTVGESTSHAVPSDLNPATTTSLAHVTRPSAIKHFDKKEVKVDGGEGEFGYGFYLTTGHETAAQRKIAEVWNKPDVTENLQQVVRFDIGNGMLRSMVANDAQRDFLVHVMQNRGGFPANMSHEDVIGMINQINVQGKVLIFPDDKNVKVKIDEKVEKSWHEYVDIKGGVGDHFLVIGPQKPDDLQGIRQIATRYQSGSYLINGVPRSQQHMGHAPSNT